MTEPFVPFWKLPWLKWLFDNRWLSILLSAASAWFALQAFRAQRTQSYPRAYVQDASIKWNKAALDFSDVDIRVEYHNVGGNAHGGTAIRLLVPNVLDIKKSPTRQGDDGDIFVRDEKRSFTLRNLNIAPNVALVACLSVDDQRVPDPQVFLFFFDKDGHMWHLGKRDAQIVLALDPCGSRA